MKNVKNEPKMGSGVPLAIIVIVLVGAVAAGYYFYNSAKTPGSKNKPVVGSNINKTAPSATPANAPPGAQPPNTLGPQTADVTVEEYADFQCPQCSATDPILKEVISSYGPKLKFVFRNYPLAIPAHDKAYEAAAAAEAAGMQGKFWPMHDQLFTNQKAWTQNPNYRQLWADYAKNMGLDVDKFQADAAGLAAKSRVDEDLKRGHALGITGTPTIYINGRSVPFENFNVAALRNLIDMEFQRAAAAKPGQAGESGGAPASNSQ